MANGITQSFQATKASCKGYFFTIPYVAAEQLQTSAVTCFELLSGARKGERGDRVRNLVALLRVLPFDRNAAMRAAEIRQQLEKAGLPIGWVTV